MCFEEESTQEEAVEPVEEGTRQMSDRLDCQIRLQGESLERDWLCDTEGKTRGENQGQVKGRISSKIVKTTYS